LPYNQKFEGPRTLKIAIQGEPGSFSHEAALRFIPDAEILPCSYSAEVFRRVLDGDVDAAAIPIENSLAGSVVEHYDLLFASDVAIERETLLDIHHNLIVVPGATLDRLHRVYSHPIALAQCRRFFAGHPEIEPVPFYDTAGSVKQLMELRDRACGAIASAQAAEYYGGAILLPHLEDDAQNFTRFFLIRRRDQAALDPEANKVSLAFQVENRPGALVGALQAFAGEHINMTRIESRPVHGSPWRYVFYTDYELARPESADRALKLLAGHCFMVKELGRYRAGTAVRMSPAPPLPS
jgi:prephenate dehydratase